MPTSAATPAESDSQDGIELAEIIHNRVQEMFEATKEFRSASRTAIDHPAPGNVASVLTQNQLAALCAKYIEVLSDGSVTPEQIDLGERLRTVMRRLGKNPENWNSDNRILADTAEAMREANYTNDDCASLALVDVVAYLESRADTLDRLKARGKKQASREFLKKIGKLGGPRTRRTPHENPERELKGKTRVTPRFAAGLLGLSDRSIRLLIEEGKLKTEGDGHRKMVTVASLRTQIRGARNSA